VIAAVRGRVKGFFELARGNHPVPPGKAGGEVSARSEKATRSTKAEGTSSGVTFVPVAWVDGETDRGPGYATAPIVQLRITGEVVDQGAVAPVRPRTSVLVAR
jgi:hypothetical protein